jgi:hypothetical protein
VPVALAFCPCPPALVPELSTGAAGELAGLRATCDRAVASLLAADPERIAVLAATPQPGEWGAGAGGSMRPYGVDVRAGGPDVVLPGALTIGAWLLDRAGWAGRRRYVGVGPDGVLADPADVREAWLVVGDGSAKRTEKAPGFVDDRAVAFDDAVAAALRAGDATALARLDVDTGDQLWSTGARVWRAVGAALAGRVVSAELLAEEAPYGVAYLVATWRPAG